MEWLQGSEWTPSSSADHILYSRELCARWQSRMALTVNERANGEADEQS